MNRTFLDALHLPYLHSVWIKGLRHAEAPSLLLESNISPSYKKKK